MNSSNNTLARRQWLMLAGAGVVTGLVPTLGWTDDHSESSSSTATSTGRAVAPAVTGLRGKIVVVGGGMAGVTAAKYLRMWGGAGLSITLVEPDKAYTSSIMSNMVLSGGRTLASLSYTHAKLQSNYAITVRRAALTAINTAGKQITLSDGSSLPYDRLVLAPGVEFEDAYGLTQADYDTRTPHAWRAGPQTQLLRNQLAGMTSGATFVMTIPKAPYRCPPGPYERACLVADYVKRAKIPGAKVIVLDENPAIQAEAHTFNEAFTVIHSPVISYRPGVSDIQINAATKVVTYSQAGVTSTINAQVVNPIVPHRATGSSASGWMTAAGLANGTNGRWAKVNVLSYESTAVAGIHIIGDASQCGLPKAGHVANQEAKICADAIVRLLGGSQPDSGPVANSACYSPITASTASWLTAVYQYDAATGSMAVASNGGKTAGAAPTESATISRKNFQNMNVWFNTLMGDTFA